MALIELTSWTIPTATGGNYGVATKIVVGTDDIIGVYTRATPYNTTGVINVLYRYSSGTNHSTVNLIVTEAFAAIATLAGSHLMTVNTWRSVSPSNTPLSAALPTLINPIYIINAYTLTTPVNTTGVTAIIYRYEDNNASINIYLPVTQTLASLVSSGGDSVAWGDITGSITAQTDLEAALNTKINKAGDTVTGELLWSDPNNRSKIILTKYPTGTGHNNAPTAFDLTSVYLHLGGTEYNTNSYRLIGFGYRHSLDSSHAAGVIGYQETSGTGSDMGRLLFATRNSTSDIAPTVRLTIETNGDIIAQTGAKFVGDGSGITGIVDASGAVVKTGNQTIAGIKTFSSSPIVPAPTTDLQAATKKYVDDKKAGAQVNSTATDVAGIVADFNSLLAGMRTAGLLAT